SIYARDAPDRIALGGWCGRGDSNPHGVTPNGFSYQLRLSPPLLRAVALRRVRGLDYPFTLPRAPDHVRSERGLGAARLVSTPSRFRAWLGIAVERFPRVWAVLRPRFPAAHSKASSPLRLPFRHARVAAKAIPTPPRVAKAFAANTLRVCADLCLNSRRF